MIEVKMPVPIRTGIFILRKDRSFDRSEGMVAATDLIDYARAHLPILLGTQVTVSRKQIPRPVHRIH